MDITCATLPLTDKRSCMLILHMLSEVNCTFYANRKYRNTHRVTTNVEYLEYSGTSQTEHGKHREFCAKSGKNCNTLYTLLCLLTDAVVTMVKTT